MRHKDKKEKAKLWAYKPLEWNLPRGEGQLSFV